MTRVCMGRSRIVVRLILLASFACVSVAAASAQPAGSTFADWVASTTQLWQGQIDRWRSAGDACFRLTVGVGILGILIGGLQPFKARWVKPVVVVLGLLVSSLTLIRTARYDYDHRSYYRAADGAEQYVLRIRRWSHPLTNSLEEEEEAIQQVRALLDELDNIARRFDAQPAVPLRQSWSNPLTGVAFAQSLPEGKKPDWLNGREADGGSVFFVGVAIDASLATARRSSFENALAAARDDLAARIGPARGYDPAALAQYLAEGASAVDRYFDREPGAGYRYYTLLALSKSRMQADASLFGFREKVRVPDEAVRAVQSVQASPIVYQVRREEAYAKLTSEAKGRVGADAFRLYETGRVARLNGDAPAAVEALEQAVRAAPEFYLAWYNLGLARNAGGDRRQAELAYRKALALEPAQGLRDASVYNTLGYLLYREGRFAEAAALFEQALVLEPSHATARRNLTAARRNLERP